MRTLRPVRAGAPGSTARPAKAGAQHAVVRAMGRAGVAGTTELLADARVPSGAQREVAQQVRAVTGNRQLQRMLAQRQPQGTARPLLRVGSQGPSVRALQEALVAAGASISADGMFGPKTRQAVIAFQSAARLGADGVVGPKTWSAIDAGGTVITTAPGKAADPKASALVKAKLLEVQLLLRKIAAQGGGSRAEEKAPAPEVAVTAQHDDEDGESSWWDDVTETVGGAVESAGETVSGIVDSVTETAGEIVDSVGAAVDDAVGAVTEAAGAVGQAVGGAVDAAVEAVTSVASDVTEAVDELVDDLGAAYASEIAAVKEFIDDVAFYLENPGKALEKLESILSDLKKKAGELLGGETEEGEPDVRTGTAEGAESVSSATVCDVAPPALTARPPAPGSQRRRVVLDIDGATEQTEGPPVGGHVNHDLARPTLEYEGDLSITDDTIVQVPKSDFGSTGAKIKIDKITWKAERGTDFVVINARLLHRVSYAVTDRPGRTDVPPDLSSIESHNWKEAADDLDPDVHKTTLGAPKRAKYWCRDLTTAHEKFHVNDGDTKMKTDITPAVQTAMAAHDIDVPWLFWRDTEVQEQVHAIAADASKQAAALRNAHMAAPGVEVRTYAADEPAYRSRAKAIRDKAKTEHWT